MVLGFDIIQRAKKGDSQALRAIYEQTIGYISAVCSRYITDREEARDIMQEVYVKAFSSIDRFTYNGEGSIRGWISRIAVNECISKLRKKKKLFIFNEDIDAPDISEEEPPEIDSIDSSQIMDAIRELPPGYRTILNLFLLEGKSHKEIASMLGIAEKTSASQYHRARVTLAKKLKAIQKQ